MLVSRKVFESELAFFSWDSDSGGKEQTCQPPLGAHGINMEVPTGESTLKMDAWKTILSFWVLVSFQGGAMSS